MRYLIPMIFLCIFILISCGPEVQGHPYNPDSEIETVDTVIDSEPQETVSESLLETISEIDSESLSESEDIDTGTGYKSQWKCLICE